MSSSTVSASSVIIPVLLVSAFLAVLLIITGIYIQVDRKTRRQGDKKTRRQEEKKTRRQEDKKTRRQEDKKIGR